MSAAHIQPGLDGFAPPPAPVQTPAHVDSPFRIVCSGRAVHDAVIRDDSSVIHIDVMLRQTVGAQPVRLPVSVSFVCPDQGSYFATMQMARQLAATLTAGVDAMARGYGFQTDQVRGQNCVRLLDADVLRPVADLISPSASTSEPARAH